MARRGRPPNAVRQSVADLEPEMEREEGADEFAGAYPNAKVMVWERVRDRPDSLIGVYDADGDVQTRIAEQVGGGDFIWKIRMANGKWASRADGVTTARGKFSISERSFPKLKAVSQAALVAVAAAPAEPALNMQQMMMAMMQQQTTLLTALIGRPGPDPIALMTAFHQMMPPAGGGGGLEAVNTAMDLMSKAKDMIPERGGGGGGSNMEDRIFSLLEAVAPTVAQRLMTPAAPQPRPAPVVMAQPASALVGAPLTEIEPAPLENPPDGDPVNLKKTLQHAMLSPYVGKLVQLSEKKADPETYADVFLDEAEDKGLTPEQIGTFFSNEKLIAELGETFAGVKKNAEWFEIFRRAVLSMLTPDREADTLTGDAPSPDAPDSPANSDA